LTGVPTECTSPPIRDGVPHTPKLIPHEPPLPTRTSSSFSLTKKKNDENRGKKALSEHFDNKSSIWPAAPHVFFSNWQTSPITGYECRACGVHLNRDIAVAVQHFIPGTGMSLLTGDFPVSGGRFFYFLVLENF
jgi:hypothetical protein